MIMIDPNWAGGYPDGCGGPPDECDLDECERCEAEGAVTCDQCGVWLCEPCFASDFTTCRECIQDAAETQCSAVRLYMRE